MEYSQKQSLFSVDISGLSVASRDEQLRALAAAVDLGLAEFAADATPSPPKMSPFPLERHPEITCYRTSFERPGRIHYQITVRPRPVNHDQAEVVVSWTNKAKEGLERGLAAAYSFMFFGFTAVIALAIVVFSDRPFQPRFLLVAALIAAVPAFLATAVVSLTFVVPRRRGLAARERIAELCSAIRDEWENRGG